MSIQAGPPLGMLAELTHRCPLQCPYCSNPLKLLKAADELDTQSWNSVFSQAADLGVLQVHLSGGEPALRQDLEASIKTKDQRAYGRRYGEERFEEWRERGFSQE